MFHCLTSQMNQNKNLNPQECRQYRLEISLKEIKNNRSLVYDFWIFFCLALISYTLINISLLPMVFQ